MAEQRLIDANVLSEEITSVRTILTGRHTLLEYAEAIRDTTIRIINEQPTVDAVPVVRCKDCKWQMDVKYNESHHYKRCLNPIYGTGISGVDLKYDDYCSYGERKDGKQND